MIVSLRTAILPCLRIAKYIGRRTLARAALTLNTMSWLELDPNPATRAEIEKLEAAGNASAIDSLMLPRIAFGTAGLRLEMAPGFANMNDVTVLQASQGLVDYVKKGPIIVGFDHRHHSRRFAEITAAVALSRGFDVYYLATTGDVGAETVAVELNQLPKHPYSQGGVVDAHVGGRFSHTPLVPFTIDRVHATAGVMVTASHNPAKDNGYKVYYGNGCQIIPPVDAEIAALIDANLKPWSDAKVSQTLAEGLKLVKLKPCLDEMQQKYIEKLLQLVTTPSLGFDFVYTPMHGVGLDIVAQALPRYFTDYKMHVVDAQAQPDPQFPTVAFPNPEERGALDLASKVASENGVKLVIANDPDADRFLAAILTGNGWRQLTGNEIGFLFAMYIVETTKTDLNKLYMVNLTVLSQILKAMAAVDGFHYVDTLTGFKWIGNKAIDLEKEGYSVPFGYEEAIGFMFATAHDKDGVAAATVFLQLYKHFNHDLEAALAKGYARYGYFQEYNGYYRVPRLTLTNEVFTAIRQLRQPLDPVGDFKTKSYRDLTTGYQLDTPDHKPNLPVDPHLQMITMVLEDPTTGHEVRFTARGLGTEPKIKIYCEGKADSELAAKALAKKCWDTLREAWFKPEEHDMTEVA